MGRPTLPPGTAGKTRTYRERSGQWTARCQYRDWDGVTRSVERTRATKGAAERALAEAVRDRRQPNGSAELKPDSKMSTIAETWWSQFSVLQRSPGTLRGYRERLDNQVLPAIGNLRAREMSVGVAERFLRAVETRYGPSTAKMTRTVLSNVCGYAARHDCIDRNPVRDTSAISVPRKKGAPRSLTLVEARQLRAALTYDQKAVERDLPDLVDGQLCTGLRIGEVCAITWPYVDLVEGCVTTGGIVMRIPGKGLIIRRDPSNKIAVRTILLPGWAADMFRRRYDATDAHGEDDAVFGAVLGGLRDPSNTEHHLREAFDNSGFDWLTSHSLRKTVATLIDKAGLPASDVADQLGHSQVSMTQNTYIGRARMVTKGAPVLDSLAH